MKRLFKITSIILIQAFLLTDLACPGAGRDMSGESALAVRVQIDSRDFCVNFIEFYRVNRSFMQGTTHFREDFVSIDQVFKAEKKNDALWKSYWKRLVYPVKWVVNGAIIAIAMLVFFLIAPLIKGSINFFLRSDALKEKGRETAARLSVSTDVLRLKNYVEARENVSLIMCYDDVEEPSRMPAGGVIILDSRRWLKRAVLEYGPDEGEPFGMRFKYYLEDYLHQNGFYSSPCAEIVETALWDGLLNAAVHGNGFFAEMPVAVTWQITPKDLIIRIYDLAVGRTCPELKTKYNYWVARQLGLTGRQMAVERMKRDFSVSYHYVIQKNKPVFGVVTLTRSLQSKANSNVVKKGKEIDTHIQACEKNGISSQVAGNVFNRDYPEAKKIVDRLLAKSGIPGVIVSDMTVSKITQRVEELVEQAI